jgi:Ras-related protein Rab-1A|tara:strand:- start:3229 stop:3825 length:597 start_codon:yes stop_codon:yes gene_type:complete
MFDYNMRLVLIGDCTVGKTAFASKLTYGYYQNNHDTTIGVDYSAKTIPINNKAMVKCQIWDTAGQEKFTPLIKTYYKNVAGVILIYDVTERNTFNRLHYWINEIQKNTPLDYPISKILIGNKIDLNRNVSHEEASILAKKNGFMYREMSVKNDINVEESLVALAQDIYKNKEENKGIKKSHIKYSTLNTEREPCCCIF